MRYSHDSFCECKRCTEERGDIVIDMYFPEVEKGDLEDEMLREWSKRFD